MADMRAVQWRLLDHTAREPVRVGDMVSADAGGMPIYRVTEVANGQVWLGGERRAPAPVVSLEAFRWRGATA